jgi:hypothetical protein
MFPASGFFFARFQFLSPDRLICGSRPDGFRLDGPGLGDPAFVSGPGRFSLEFSIRSWLFRAMGLNRRP